MGSDHVSKSNPLGLRVLHIPYTEFTSPDINTKITHPPPGNRIPLHLYNFLHTPQNTPLLSLKRAYPNFSILARTQDLLVEGRETEIHETGAVGNGRGGGLSARRGEGEDGEAAAGAGERVGDVG